MSIFQDIASIGLPTGAIALAVGLVRGAKALEKDANEEALRYVSKLLLQRDISQTGSVSTTLIPVVFDRIFGSSPLSVRFIFRSVIASLTFWFILALSRNYIWHNFSDDLPGFTIFLIPAFLIVDWVSLVKAKFLIKMVLSLKRNMIWTLAFFLIDLVLSYALSLLCLFLCLALLGAAVALIYEDGISQIPNILTAMRQILVAWLHLNPFAGVFYKSSEAFSFKNVFIPSTMLTTIWTFLLFVSCLVAQLLAPIDHLRRFATWWFRDVERRPLTVIAKVAATLIIVGAFGIKAVHWIY